MDRDQVRLELLRPAVEGLRLALRKMEPRDVPVGLRRLADSAARKVPPPHLRKAVNELDSSEWLRVETAAASDLADESASQLFIDRPEGWEGRLERMIEERSSRRIERQSSHTDRLLAQAEERIAGLEADLRSEQKAAAAAEGRGEERHVAKLKAAEKGRREAVKQARAEARLRHAAEEKLDESLAALRAAEGRVESQRQLLEKERRTAAEIQTAANARGWFPAEPIDMATELDRIVTATRRPPRVSVTSRTPALSVPPMPPGVRPDRKEAVEWLVKQPLTWLIDGYNLAFQFDPEPDSVTRGRVVAAIGRLVTLSGPPTMAVVVFDSSVDEFSPPADRRVAVAFVPSADDKIMADARPGTVVVTSDRRVRESAQASGAIGLWSEAMAEWIRSSR